MVIARAHGETQPMGMAAIYNHLGTYYLQHRDHVTAMDNFNEALVILKANVGEDHPYVLTVTHNVAACMLGLGQWQQAEALQRKLIVAKQRVLGPDTQPVGQSWEAIAGALANQGKLDEAADAYQESLRIFAARLGEDSGFTANALRNVAMMHYMQNRSDQALALLDRSLATGDRNGTGDTRAVAFERVQRALVLFATGQHEQAIAEGRIALDDVDRLALDASDEYRADARSMLATMLIAVGEYADAERRLREAVEIQAAILPPTSAKLACCRCLLGAALALGGDEPTGEAHQLLEQNYSTISSWGLIDPVQRRILAEARAAAGLANR